jgi:hypothetical protein
MNQVPFPSLVQKVLPLAFNTGLFTSLCTVQAPDGLIGPGGSPSGTYAAVAGIVAIPCMDAPPSTLRVQATEVKALAEIMAKAFRHVLLNGYFGNLIVAAGPIGTGGNASGWRAVVTNSAGVSTTYDILGAEADSQRTQTRLELQLVGV